MNRDRRQLPTVILILALGTLAGASLARADVVTEANARAAEIASRTPSTPFSVRAMALTQVAVFEAVNAITRRYPPIHARLEAAPGAAVAAAVAAATHAVLAKLRPDQLAAIDADYQAELAAVPDGAARTDGVALGERAAAAILDWRGDDGALAAETYRPHTTAGLYVPTTVPAVPQWGRRRPWVLTTGDELRPGPPPALTSDLWTRDFNEIKALGAKENSRRTPEQTAAARFWTATVPVVYWHVARSVADAPGRDVAANARLLAAAGMAMDDALIAVFDAKYAYEFWRPITAIRNADLDGNDATARDPGWVPFIDTPMHPEYPCAHCIVSAALGAVLEAEIGAGPTPPLRSESPTAPGEVRTWTSVGDFEREVDEARICDGVHFRNSTEVGTAMGRKIGALAAKSLGIGGTGGAR